MTDPVVLLAVLQGALYVASAAWALLHVDSFMRVTGAKTDVWLVKAVAALVLVIGAALLAGAWRGRIGPDLAFLAVGSATALALVDVFYVVQGTIARIYLLDALVQALLVAGWVLVLTDGAGLPAPAP
ncbi:MAG: hypothetical protein M9894_13185 [Planctomycetes bacterium]|nr:hypothetical protein [Planctomycetota bacterium]